MNPSIKKISVLGNPCSGKTTFALQIKNKLNLPLYHIDSFQFLEGMLLRNPDETRKILLEISELNEWIIDGVGPLKVIENRLQKSDLIICLRLPLWMNYLLMIKRQFQALFSRRKELPPNCFEATPQQTYRLIKNIWNVNFGLWKQLDRILLEDKYKNKVVYLKSFFEISQFLNNPSRL